MYVRTYRNHYQMHYFNKSTSAKVQTVSKAATNQRKVVDMKINIDPESSEDNSTKFWIRKFETDGGDNDADPPVLPSMSPFWFLHDVTKDDDAIPLRLIRSSFEVPLSVSSKVTKKGEFGDSMKKAAVSKKWLLEVPVYTNDVEIAKGSSICLGDELEEETVINCFS